MATSQTLMVASYDADARRMPSGLKAQLLMVLLWRMVRMQVPDATSHTFKSREPDRGRVRCAGVEKQQKPGRLLGRERSPRGADLHRVVP